MEEENDELLKCVDSANHLVFPSSVLAFASFCSCAVCPTLDVCEMVPPSFRLHFDFQC